MWPCLEVCFDCHDLGGGASGSQWIQDGGVAKFAQDKAPATKNYAAPNVHSAEVEKV